jgi:hypothetical protein
MKLFLIGFFLIGFLSNSQANTGDTTKTPEIEAFQKELNSHYKSKEHSPLTKKDRRKFSKHNFFKIDLNYIVTADIKLTPESDTFGMKTTTERKPLYQQYGIAYFTVNGVNCKLSIYQNIKYSQIEGHENNLFLLFNDQTNGTETYGGGRYIDLEKPLGSNIIINFNLSYNPYCHYNSKYSCPIPPPENYLPLEIRAGIKSFEGAKHH